MAEVKYFTAEEIAVHCTIDDCWVSVFDNVYNITELVAEHRGPLTDPFVKEAGSSISSWFDPVTRGVKTFIDPVRNIRMPYTPQGRFVHVPPPDPKEYNTIIGTPWWEDEQYIIGKFTVKKRPVKILNILTQAVDIITTAQEDTINNILERYLEYNAHAKSYTWKVLLDDKFVCLDMQKTLLQNGIPDESETFVSLDLDEDYDIPTLYLYFNDDLTYA